MYSISTRLLVNNQYALFFYLIILDFLNMASLGNKRRCLATTAS